MAIEEKLQVITREAGSDLSSSQWRFMTVAADGQVDATGDGLEADGVLQNDPGAAGRAAAIATIGGGGISKVEVGGATTRGNPVSSDSAGRAVNSQSGDYILGEALDTATTAGEIISVLLGGRPGVWAG